MVSNQSVFAEFALTKLIMLTGKVPHEHLGELQSLLEKWNGNTFLTIGGTKGVTKRDYATEEMECDVNQLGTNNIPCKSNTHTPGPSPDTTSREALVDWMNKVNGLTLKARKERKAKKVAKGSNRAGKRTGQAQQESEETSASKANNLTNKERKARAQQLNQLPNAKQRDRLTRSSYRMSREKKATDIEVAKGYDGGPASSIIGRRIEKAINAMEFDFNNLSMKTT